MTPQQIVALGIRLLAIAILVFSVKYLISVPLNTGGSGLDPSVISMSYIVGGVCVLVAVLLWLFPMAIAHKIVPRTRFDNYLTLNAHEAARVGCSLVGLWLLAQTIPNALWFLFAALATPGEQSFLRSLNVSQRTTLAFYTCQLVLSTLLILKSDWFAHLTLRKSEQGESSGEVL